MAFYRHRANIVRSLHGTENKVFLSSKNKKIRGKIYGENQRTGFRKLGYALALLLYNNGHEVLLWSARPEDARKLREKRENPDRLPGVQIPEDIEILTDLERAIKSADVTVLAVASPYIRSTAHKMAPFIRKGQKIVNVAKGIEEKH